jgi:hypothetical protein
MKRQPRKTINYQLIQAAVPKGNYTGALMMFFKRFLRERRWFTTKPTSIAFANVAFLKVVFLCCFFIARIVNTSLAWKSRPIIVGPTNRGHIKVSEALS